MRKLHRVVAVVGAALILGLLASGTVTVTGSPGGGPPGPPGPPPKPEPPPKITPQQIIDGVNQLIPHLSLIRIPPQLLTRYNGLPADWFSAARVWDDGGFLLAFPREGVRLFGARSLDDGVILGRQADGTRLGAIELMREYKLGSNTLKQGYYHVAAFYDPNNELDAQADPKNERDFHLVLVSDLNGNGQIDEEDIHGFISLPHLELAHVIAIVDPALQIQFAQAILLNLIAALLQ